MGLLIFKANSGMVPKHGLFSASTSFTTSTKYARSRRTNGCLAGQALTGLSSADDHEYRVEPLDNGRRTLFIQTDVGGGFIGKILGRPIANFDKRIFMAFNERLKARVEEMFKDVNS